MPDATITLKLKGNPDDPDLVEAGTLAEFLKRTVGVLRSIARDLGGDRGLRIVVINLIQSSAEVQLEIRRKRRTKLRARPHDVVDVFTESTRVLARGGRLPPQLSRESVAKLGGMTDALRPGLAATFGLNGESVQVTTEWKERAVGGLSTGRAVDGLLRGHLEGIDVHGESRFFLYPVLADRRVECHFKLAQLELVREALGKYVAVEGLQTYAPDATWPDRIDVTALIAYPDHAQLPSMMRLVGLSESLERGLTVDQHIQRVARGEA